MLITLVVAPTVTLTFTMPTVPGGLVAPIPLSPLRLKQLPDAGHGGMVVDPKAMAVAPVKPLPVICTPVPPDAGPPRGLTPLTTGGPATSKVNLSYALVALDAPPTVTLTSTVVPAAPGGLVTPMKLSPKALKQAAPGAGHGGGAVDPNATTVTPEKPLPPICTLVPPAAVPWLGITESTTGVEAAYAGGAMAKTAPAMKTGRRMGETPKPTG